MLVKKQKQIERTNKIEKLKWRCRLGGEWRQTMPTDDEGAREFRTVLIDARDHTQRHTRRRGPLERTWKVRRQNTVHRHTALLHTIAKTRCTQMSPRTGTGCCDVTQIVRRERLLITQICSKNREPNRTVLKTVYRMLRLLWLHWKFKYKIITIIIIISWSKE